MKKNKYELKPTNNYGYQPKESVDRPKPPTSGSNIIKADDKKIKMKNIEHLIENVILGMKEGKDVYDCLNEPHNQSLTHRAGVDADDIAAIAQHVVYTLYNGKFPE